MKIKSVYILPILVSVWVGFSLAPYSRIATSRQFRTAVNTVDLDAGMILQGLAEKKNFWQTFDWWAGSWCQKTAFFRPLTSQLWWLEYKVFGPKRLYLWLVVALISQIAALVLYWQFSNRLFGSRLLSALTIAAMTFPQLETIPEFPGKKFLYYPGFTVYHNHLTYPYWKNSPEYWVAIPFFAAGIAFLTKRYWLTLFCLIVAISAKETGFALFGAIVVIAWYKRQGAPRWFWPSAFAITLTMFLYRYWAVGIGYRLGSNNAWWWRAGLYYGSNIIYPLYAQTYHNLIAGVGSAVFIIWLLWLAGPGGNKKLVQVFGCFSVLIVSWLLAGLVAIPYLQRGLNRPVELTEAVAGLLIANWALVQVIGLAVILPLAIRYYGRSVAAAYLMMVVCSAGLFAAAQVLAHAFYVADFFRVATFWLGCFGFWQFLKKIVQQPTAGTAKVSLVTMVV